MILWTITGSYKHGAVLVVVVFCEGYVEQKNVKRRYSTGEEIASSITHGAGTCLSVVALVLLIVRAVHHAPVPLRSSYIVGFIIFGVSLILLYLSSTLYHALTNQTAKKIFGIFDHGSIYLLIAGTYTAYCLTALHGALGWIMFGIIWGIATAGITFYAIFGSKMRVISAITYIPMGLIIFFVSHHLKENLAQISGGTASWNFLLIGGACYILGTAVYALKKIKWTHPVWHIFVIAGSIMHFFSLFLSI